MIALVVIMTFLTLLQVSSMPLSEEQASNFIEKEHQVSYQTTPKNVLFQDSGLAAAYTGAFDNKGTMRDNFQFTSGAKGKWTAKEK